MADFVAVLRKTIDSLAEHTPEARARVYAKARATIAGKLAALNPPPPPTVFERQKRALEDAIGTVEAEYEAAESTPLDEDEDLEVAIASLGQAQPYESPRPHASEPAGAYEPYEPAPLAAPAPDIWSPDEEEVYEPQPIRRTAGRRYGGPLLAVLGLLILGGAGYAAWLNQDQIAGLLDLNSERAATAPTEAAVEAAAPPIEVAEEEPATTTPLVQEQPQAAETEIAAVDPEPDPAPLQPEPTVPAAPAVEAPLEKFTQRLRSDGTEIDEGPAGDEPEIGEGTSVAAVTAAAAPQSPPPLESPQPSAAAVPAVETPAAAEPGVAIGQKAIFYEERTNVAQGSAEDGSIVWSLVQESPGGDLPPEPAIRAEATIPGKDVQLRMTIRRNGDQTLPASHIVEMIFLTPDDFDGGGIDNVLRIALKDSEQAAGNPLLGIPAKISEGFFLVALGDGAAEVQANTTLLRRQSWIDIPIVYRSGRRALITLEKGIPGDRVFDEALRAWQAASGG